MSEALHSLLMSLDGRLDGLSTHMKLRPSPRTLIYTSLTVFHQWPAFMWNRYRIDRSPVQHLHMCSVVLEYTWTSLQPGAEFNHRTSAKLYFKRGLNKGASAYLDPVFLLLLCPAQTHTHRHKTTQGSLVSSNKYWNKLQRLVLMCDDCSIMMQLVWWWSDFLLPGLQL